MRIDTELSEDESQRVQNLADEQGLQKPKAYTNLIRAAFPLQKRREKIKDYIVRFFEQAKPRHKERVEALKDEYGIESFGWDERRFLVQYKGDEYEFSSDPSDLHFVNGKSYRMDVCPECESEDTVFRSEEWEDDDVPNYSCQDCGADFDEIERTHRVPKEDAENVKEFSWSRHQLAGYVEGRLIDILEKTMSVHGGSMEWTGPGILNYDNGFQSVTIPWMCTDHDRIHFNSMGDHFFPDFDSILNPLSRRDKQLFTEDYLKLVAEVEAVNPDADSVRSGRRISRPDVIRVKGSEYEETELPYRTVGYEVSKVHPDPADIASGGDAGETTWIQITGDKRIELPKEYEDSEEFYLAISTESLNPIHFIDRDTDEPLCGEDLPGMITEDDRLEEQPVVRNGLCSDCLNDHEDF